MTASSAPVHIELDGGRIEGTFLVPESRIPGVLFVHGWGGSQESDLARARGIAGLGCVCLTFDLRGHGVTRPQQETVTREHNLGDLLAAYDRLAGHPSIDSTAIAVMGNSYGAYLAAILTELRPVKWLALTVPALYRDEDWHTPKKKLPRADLERYRRSPVGPADNRALGACARFEGDVLILEAANDHLVPHTTVMNYRRAFERAHSLTYRRIDGADHAMTGERCQRAYTSILVGWATEMIIGRRIGSAES